MKKRVITFGEIMMRLNPEGYLRFLHADRFEASYAGGEANVAVSLANYAWTWLMFPKYLPMRLVRMQLMLCVTLV